MTTSHRNNSEILFVTAWKGFPTSFSENFSLKKASRKAFGVIDKPYWSEWKANLGRVFS